MGTDCSEKHEPLFLETEIDRQRALETEQFMHLSNSFSEIPTRLLVLLLSNAVINSTDFTTVVCDLFEDLSFSRQ
jgi:hypothetical protein